MNIYHYELFKCMKLSKRERQDKELFFTAKDVLNTWWQEYQPHISSHPFSFLFFYLEEASTFNLVILLLKYVFTFFIVY